MFLTSSAPSLACCIVAVSSPTSIAAVEWSCEVRHFIRNHKTKKKQKLSQIRCRIKLWLQERLSFWWFCTYGSVILHIRFSDFATEVCHRSYHLMVDSTFYRRVLIGSSFHFAIEWLGTEHLDYALPFIAYFIFKKRKPPRSVPFKAKLMPWVIVLWNLSC